MTGRRFAPPWGLVGMLALVAGAEWGLARNAHRFMTPAAMDWKAGGTLARSAARGADVLCFGDSMLKFGLAPRVLEGRLGRPVYGLALMDGKPAASYFLFRRAVEAGARPKVVLVDYQPECMFEPNDHLLENQHWKALLSLRECLDLLATYRDPVFFARTAVARFLPSYRCRAQVRAEVVAALGGWGGDLIEENAKVARNREVNRGGVLLAKRPGYSGEVPASWSATMYEGDWFGRPEHTSYVRRFLRLAGAHGIAVVWVLPPNVPEIERTRERIGMAGRFERYARGVVRRYPHLRVVDARRSGFGPGVFTDPVHLDRDGALALSLGVADVLRPLLAGAPAAAAESDRWVTLPPPRGSDSPVALEDVEQSRAALRR